VPSDRPHICRRLILLLDGTWNEDNDKQPATNIVYLRERLFWGLQTRLRDQLASAEKRPVLPESHKKTGTSGFVFDGFEYIVYYDRGVGTGPYLDPIKGGVTGKGLDHNIRKAYKFLSQWFRPGDEIFVFGFSRGAFTARSLCGYLQAVGLLRAEVCNAENELRAWNFYRTPPADRLSADWLYFRQVSDRAPLVHGETEMRVRALAVFDTVGALGVPVVGFRRINRSKYEFHDTDVGSLVDIRLHAIAIDEPRLAFTPAPMTKPKFKVIDQDKSATEQVWFAGAHADIGGGYVNWNEHKRGLSHLPLTWMLQRLQYHLANTPPLAPPAKLDTATPPQRNAPIPFFTEDLFSQQHGGTGTLMTDKIQGLSYDVQHKPWALVKVVRPALRIINQIQLSKVDSKQAVGLVPHSDPIGEMIHLSALERMSSEKPIIVDKGLMLGFVDKVLNVVKPSHSRYAPPNLTGIIPFIAATYLRKHGAAIDTQWKNFVATVFSWKEIRVVDWDGRPLDPEANDDVVRVFQLLPTPEQVQISAMPPEMEIVRMPATADVPTKSSTSASQPGISQSSPNPT
jgi:T6SS, Phospholipase effector Tle1-like, catalytic domain